MQTILLQNLQNFRTQFYHLPPHQELPKTIVTKFLISAMRKYQPYKLQCTIQLRLLLMFLGKGTTRVRYPLLLSPVVFRIYEKSLFKQRLRQTKIPGTYHCNLLSAVTPDSISYILAQGKYILGLPTVRVTSLYALRYLYINLTLFLGGTESCLVKMKVVG